MAAAGTLLAQDRRHTIAGTTYTLRFSLRAWNALAEAWNLNNVQEAQKRLASIGDEMTVGALVDVFWAALQRHHPDISREDALNIGDDAGIDQLTEILSSLIRASSPPVEAANGRPTRARTAIR